MILSDVITLSPELEVSEKNQDLMNARFFRKKLSAAQLIKSDQLNWEEQKGIDSILIRYTEAYDKSRLAVFDQSMNLPEDLQTNEGIGARLIRASVSSKIALSEVRTVADKLGFIVLPFDYLADASYEKESYEMRQAICGFYNCLKGAFAIYVLCPPHFYDVQAHVKSEVDREIYASSAVAQAFMAISMTIPMFRTFSGNMKEMREHSNAMARQLDRMNGEIQNLSKRVASLEVALKQHQEEVLLQKAREQKRITEMREMMARSSYLAYEPMLLALPKSKSISTDNGHAIVGPCWGPDFPDIVMEVLSLKKVAGQREKLKALAVGWRNY